MSHEAMTTITSHAKQTNTTGVTDNVARWLLIRVTSGEVCTNLQFSPASLANSVEPVGKSLY